MCTIKSIREAVGDCYGEMDPFQSTEALDRLDELLPLRPRAMAAFEPKKSPYYQYRRCKRHI